MNFPTTFALVLLVAAPAFADPPDGADRAGRAHRPFPGAPRGVPSGVGSAAPPAGAAAAPGSAVPPTGSAGHSHGRGPGEHGGLRFHMMTPEMREKMREKKFDPEQFKKQVAEWKESREKRREEQRKALIQRWGAAVAKPTVADELRLHAKRLARLQRFEELIATDKQGDARTRMLDRVQKMREQEDQRHERAMQRLANEASPAAPAAASGGVAPAAAPAASPAPATSGGVQ